MSPSAVARCRGRAEFGPRRHQLAGLSDRGSLEARKISSHDAPIPSYANRSNALLTDPFTDRGMAESGDRDSFLHADRLRINPVGEVLNPVFLDIGGNGRHRRAP